MIKYISIFLFAVAISSFSQLLLAQSAKVNYESRIKEYLNLRVILAYCIFFGATLLSLVAYKVVPLSMGPILESSGYLWVAIFSRLFLNEKIKKKKIIGLTVIILGIVVFTI